MGRHRKDTPMLRDYDGPVARPDRDRLNLDGYERHFIAAGPDEDERGGGGGEDDDPLPDMVRRPWLGWLHRWHCPACGERMPAGQVRDLAYSLHYSQAHLDIRPFRSLN